MLETHHQPFGSTSSIKKAVSERIKLLLDMKDEEKAGSWRKEQI